MDHLRDMIHPAPEGEMNLILEMIGFMWGATWVAGKRIDAAISIIETPDICPSERKLRLSAALEVIDRHRACGF